MGTSVKLKPRHIVNAGDNEPLMKRICVAPTALHCFSAIGCWNDQTINVYQTKRKVVGVKAWRVPDQTLTKEHWRFKDTDFVLVAKLLIPSKVMWPYGSRGDGPSNERYWNRQLKDKENIRSWLRRKGDPRLYKIDDADQSWRVSNDILEEKKD